MLGFHSVDETLNVVGRHASRGFVWHEYRGLTKRMIRMKCSQQRLPWHPDVLDHIVDLGIDSLRLNRSLLGDEKDRLDVLTVWAEHDDLYEPFASQLSIKIVEAHQTPVVGQLWVL